jgi:hypothetical protein
VAARDVVMVDAIAGSSSKVRTVLVRTTGAAVIC